LMVSHMLAHVALRRELLPVYEALFQAGGPQLRFRPASRYGLTGRPLGVDALRHAAAQRGEVFLGVRLHAERNRRSGVRLQPPRSFSATLTADDDLLVLVNE
ncbi:MAG: ion channel DMI1, partial [Bacteroidota bacterium]